MVFAANSSANDAHGSAFNICNHPHGVCRVVYDSTNKLIMLTGEIRSKIDALWNAFWSGGIANPLEVIEQITYLLFLKRLDDLHTLEENKSTRLKKPMERRVFPEGNDPKGRPYDDLRWSRFKNFEAKEMYAVV